MGRMLVLAIALLVVASAANAADMIDWHGTLNLTGLGAGSVDVRVDAVLNGGIWDWSYLVTPQGGATNLSAFSLDVGAAALSPTGGNITNISSSGGAAGWAASTSTGVKIQWTAGDSGAPLNTPAPGLFTFKSIWGPSIYANARAIDGGTYEGRLRSPVPEPMSVMLGVLGLSSIAGFRRLRRK